MLPSLIWSAIQKLPFLFQLWFCFTSLARLPCPQPLQPAAQAYTASPPQLLFLSSAISQPWPPRKMSANSSNPAKTYFSFIPGTPYQDRSSTEEILPYLLGPRPCPPRFSSSPTFWSQQGEEQLELRQSAAWGQACTWHLGSSWDTGNISFPGVMGYMYEKPDLQTDGREALGDLRKAKAGGCFPQREQICRSRWGHSADECCCRWQRSGSAWSTPAGKLQVGLNKRTDTGSRFC